MATIVVENLFGKSLELPRPGETLLAALQAHYIDWMHSCGGRGRCTTCNFRIIQGVGNLGELTPSEVAYRQRHQLADEERLACQARIYGDVIISVPDETKLPHISYSD